LNDNSNESKDHEAELLLMNLLGVKQRIQLFLDFDKPLTTQEIADYRERLVRCKKGEPLQYITGEAPFYGRDYFTDKDVFIPRFDTETLAKVFIDQARSFPKITIIDIGTGSGILAISGALALPNARVIAIDISESAITLAKKNAKYHKVADRIEFIKGDLLEEAIHLDISGPLFIVSNPPYIDYEDPHIESNVRKYEPANALFAAGNGLAIYKKILQQSNYFGDKLKGIFFETGFKQGQSIKSMIEFKYSGDVVIEKDISGNDRVVSFIKD